MDGPVRVRGAREGPVLPDDQLVLQPPAALEDVGAVRAPAEDDADVLGPPGGVEPVADILANVVLGDIGNSPGRPAGNDEGF